MKLTNKRFLPFMVVFVFLCVNVQAKPGKKVTVKQILKAQKNRTSIVPKSNSHVAENIGQKDDNPTIEIAINQDKKRKKQLNLSKHAGKRMKERSIPMSRINMTVKNGIQSYAPGNAFKYQNGNITVIVSKDKKNVITTYLNKSDKEKTQIRTAQRRKKALRQTGPLIKDYKPIIIRKKTPAQKMILEKQRKKRLERAVKKIRAEQKKNCLK